MYKRGLYTIIMEERMTQRPLMMQMMIIVLESVGLNPAWIAIIFPVDRILDMIRTVVNVTGDATVSMIVAKSVGKLGDPNPEDWDDHYDEVK